MKPKKDETYWVPITRTETTTAKIKVSADSPAEATQRAKALCASLTPQTLMTAMGVVQKTELEFGRPWQPETIAAGATMPMAKLERRAR
jgi:hypothetical protein